MSSHLNQYGDAHLYFAEALHSYAEITPRNQSLLAECLAGLSLLLIKEREAEKSAEILRVIDHLLDEEGYLDTTFQSVYDQSLTTVKELLSEETFDSQVALGRSLTIAQALNYALKVNGEFTPTD